MINVYDTVNLVEYQISSVVCIDPVLFLIKCKSVKYMSFSDYTDYVAMWRRYPMAIIYNALPSVDSFLFLRFELCSNILLSTIIIRCF